MWTVLPVKEKLKLNQMVTDVVNVENTLKFYVKNKISSSIDNKCDFLLYRSTLSVNIT